MKNLNPSVSLTTSIRMFPILLIVFSFLFPATVSASYHFTKATTCKDVQNGVPIHETTSFAKHERPHAWMKLSNVHGYVKGHFEWSQNGQVYATNTSQNTYSSGGNVIYFNKPNFGNRYGDWIVKFYVLHNGHSYLHATKTIHYGGCICPTVIDPVCGTDGKTYNNACEAECAGVWVASKGACDIGSTCDLLARSTFPTDLCSSCLSEIAVYRFNGKNFLVSDGRNTPNCSDAMTTVEDCITGTTLCRQGGIAGLRECSRMNFFANAVKKQVIVSDDCSRSATCACTSSQVNNFCEDFQSYNPQRKLGPQSNCWTTWTGAEGGAKDGNIRRNNNSKNQYLQIKGNNPHGGGHQDVVLRLGNRTSGCFHLEFKMWVFQGHKGYYNIMHRFDTNSPSTNQWASQVFFDGNGTGRLNIKGNFYPFQYSMGKWIKVSQHFDLDNDLTELHIDGKKIAKWRFSLQAANTHPGANRLRAIAFHPPSQAYEYYIDDIKFNKAANLTEEVVAESRSGDMVDESEVFTIVQNTDLALAVSPNPFQNSINIQIPAGATTGELTIFDQFGRLVRQLPTTEDQTEQTLTIDVSDLVSGIYYVRLTADGAVTTEKIIKQ